MDTAKSVTTGTTCSAETGNGRIGEGSLTMGNNANCITCRHKKGLLSSVRLAEKTKNCDYAALPKI